VNGKARTPQHADDYAQMILSLPAGTERITARFVRTQDRTWGIAISALATCILLLLLKTGKPRSLV
jgi:hypothetical protein